jgi:hypothetical protein
MVTFMKFFFRWMVSSSYNVATLTRVEAKGLRLVAKF